MKTFRVYTTPDVNNYLKKHMLTFAFQKAANKLKSGNFTGLQLRKREPKSLNIWYFRITKQYRAWAERDGNKLNIYKVDDHQ